jgi:hypothetical protein
MCLLVRLIYRKHRGVTESDKTNADEERKDYFIVSVS